MKKKTHRLVPLETLYPNFPPKEQPKAKKRIPFYKPGVSASIPENGKESVSVRYLQASTIRRELASLEQPLRDIEDDAAFIANSMNAALQVPKAIEMTFNRIHGRIYDIQREIEYSSNTQDDKALIIQNNFRMSYNKKHLSTIVQAIHTTVQRDCAPIYQCLLGFLLAYAKADDHFKMLLNRRFLVRNRYALRYWREWSIQSRELEKKQIAEIAVMQKNWIDRICLNLIKKWKWLSFSKHSRKALHELHNKIATEAQRRLADRQALSTTPNSSDSIFELLAIERENVIIDFGRQNYANHMQSIVFKYWRLYIEQCKNESRSGNAIARQYYINHMKRSFFNAWYSLSVGRIVIFGGYSVWRRPENKRLAAYKASFNIQKKVLKAWLWLCIRRKRLNEFSKKRERKFMHTVLIEFHLAAAKRRESLSQMMENYINFLHMKMHKIFNSWHCYTVKEKVRKQPAQFLLNRSILKRKYRIIRQYFKRWNVKFLTRQTLRFQTDTKNIESYIRHWSAAGTEMRQSMVLISQLNTKLTGELQKRKEDLETSVATTNFMRNEQKSLAFAMQNAKDEIERLHEIVGKSSMRYFVDIKPVHGHVVRDVPGALQQYIEQKELEKQKLLQQKQQTQQEKIIQQRSQKSPSPTKQLRRKTNFINQHSKGRLNPSRSSNRSRKSTSTTYSNDVLDSNGDEEEEEE